MNNQPANGDGKMLQCRTCKETKPAFEFVRSKREKDGFVKLCLECHRNKHRESYHADLKQQRELVRIRNGRNQRHKRQITKSENKKPGVYIIEMRGVFKIGRSINVKERVSNIIGSLPYRSRLVAIIETEQGKEVEYELHSRFSTKRLNGEWFALDEADIHKIKNPK